MRKLVEFIFEKLPGNNKDFTFQQKAWAVFIAVLFTSIILYKSVTDIIENY